jgi:hypothetical protein
MMSMSEGVIVLLMNLGFSWFFYAAWPYSGLFFLVAITLAGIWEEIRGAACRHSRNGPRAP